MGRRVFLTTLGTGRYQSAVYQSLAGEVETESTPYVQEARLRAALEPWDAVLVLITEGARKENWVARGSGPYNSSAVYRPDGLKSRLEGAALPVVEVPIPEGNDEPSLWTIFEQISGKIQSGDELYVDITHGLRSLPVVLLTALDYLRLARGVTLKQVTYGAFEAKKNEVVPTFDLTPFFVLQDWTAALVLLDSGDFRSLGNRLGAATAQFGRILQKRNPPQFKKLAESLRDLGETLLFNNMPALPAKTQDALGAIDAAKEAFPRLFEEAQVAHLAGQTRAMVAVLDKVRDEVRLLLPPPGSPEEMYGIYAARYCLNRGLIVQALTLLRETLLSYVLRLAGCDEAPRKQVEAFFGAFTLGKGAVPDPDRIENEDCRPKFCQLHLPPHPLLAADPSAAEERYHRIKKMGDQVGILRNALNHAGTGGEGKIYHTQKYADFAGPALDDLEAWIRELPPVRP